MRRARERARASSGCTTLPTIGKTRVRTTKPSSSKSSTMPTSNWGILLFVRIKLAMPEPQFSIPLPKHGGYKSLLRVAALYKLECREYDDCFGEQRVGLFTRHTT